MFFISVLKIKPSQKVVKLFLPPLYLKLLPFPIFLIFTLNLILTSLDKPQVTGTLNKYESSRLFLLPLANEVCL